MQRGGLLVGGTDLGARMWFGYVSDIVFAGVMFSIFEQVTIGL